MRVHKVRREYPSSLVNRLIWPEETDSWGEDSWFFDEQTTSEKIQPCLTMSPSETSLSITCVGSWIGPSTGYPHSRFDGEDLLRVPAPRLPLSRTAVEWGGDPAHPRSARASDMQLASCFLLDLDCPSTTRSPEMRMFRQMLSLQREIAYWTNPIPRASVHPLLTKPRIRTMKLRLQTSISQALWVFRPSSMCHHVSRSTSRQRCIASNRSPPHPSRTAPVQSAPLAWFRVPIASTICLPSGKLLLARTVRLEEPVWVEDGHTVLALHVTSRPYSSGPATRRLVTFALINRRRTEGKTPRNSECFFQCSFSVRGGTREPCFLSYPERPSDLEDPEERSLRLLYRHRRVFAVAHVRTGVDGGRRWNRDRDSDRSNTSLRDQARVAGRDSRARSPYDKILR